MLKKQKSKGKTKKQNHQKQKIKRTKRFLMFSNWQPIDFAVAIGCAERHNFHEAKEVLKAIAGINLEEGAAYLAPIENN